MHCFECPKYVYFSNILLIRSCSQDTAVKEFINLDTTFKELGLKNKLSRAKKHFSKYLKEDSVQKMEKHMMTNFLKNQITRIDDAIKSEHQDDDLNLDKLVNLLLDWEQTYNGLEGDRLRKMDQLYLNPKDMIEVLKQINSKCNLDKVAEKNSTGWFFLYHNYGLFSSSKDQETFFENEIKSLLQEIETRLKKKEEEVEKKKSSHWDIVRKMVKNGDTCSNEESLLFPLLTYKFKTKLLKLFNRFKSKKNNFDNELKVFLISQMNSLEDLKKKLKEKINSFMH